MLKILGNLKGVAFHWSIKIVLLSNFASHCKYLTLRIFSLVNSCSRIRGIYAHTRPSEYLCKYRLSSKFRNLTTIFQLIPLIFTMIIRFVFWHGQIGSVKYYLRSKMLRYFLSNFCPRYSWYFDGYKTILLEIKIVSSYLK